MPFLFPVLLLLLTCFPGYSLLAQNAAGKLQYPAGLRNAYFGVNAGALQYRFSAAQLEPGFSVGAVQAPAHAVRLILYGRPIGRHIAAQVTYMRPVDWVKFKNINGDQRSYNVWMNYAGLTLTGSLALSSKLVVAGEAGLCIITRKGFSIGGKQVVRDAVYGDWMGGLSLQYRLRPKWRLTAGVLTSPYRKNERQPSTTFLSAGFSYHLIPFTADQLAQKKKTARYFPGQSLQIGYTTNALGYGVNNAVSKGPVPIFWGGEVHLRSGVSINYQRTVFHARKVFAFDIGAGAGWWQTDLLRQRFFTATVYPALKFYAWRHKHRLLYFEYTAAGPAFLSKPSLDTKSTGKRFTFYDALGAGFISGKKSNLLFSVRIAHFSNGNIFPRNDGVKVPLSFSLGYCFP